MNGTDPIGLRKVLVRYTKIWGWVPYAYHAYIVTVDPSGQMTGFKGGPGEDGNIKTTNNVPYDKEFPDYEPGSPGKVLCQKVLDDDKPCLKINLKLAEAFNRIDAAHIPYHFLTTNSNAAVPYALGSAGLPVPTPSKWAPGWGFDPFFDPFAQDTFSADPTGMGGLPHH